MTDKDKQILRNKILKIWYDKYADEFLSVETAEASISLSKSEFYSASIYFYTDNIEYIHDNPDEDLESYFYVSIDKDYKIFISCGNYKHQIEDYLLINDFAERVVELLKEYK